MNFDYDLFVIGAGSGGVRAARVAASHGASVALAEESRFGGTCVIRGCVPKKLLVYGSQFRGDLEDAVGFGWRTAAPVHDWTAMMAAVNAEIDRLEAVYQRLLEGTGVKTYRARARIVGPHTLDVDGETVRARVILVATGAVPVTPTFPGADLVLSSNEALRLEAMPRRIAVVGGGYIACEFAGIFHGFGAAVTQLHRGENILRGFDDDVRVHVAAEMRSSGIDLRLASEVAELARHPGGLSLYLKNGDVIQTDAVLVATGRRCNTRGLGLEEAGVELDETGAIRVNERSQTSVEHIFAVGDVTNRMNLTPVAIAEGHAFADTEFGKRNRVIDHRNVPSAVFSQPQVATVGLTEQQARASVTRVEVFKTTFRPMRAAISGRDERILMKLVVNAETDQILGAHMVGADASEVIQGIAIAVKMGATKADFDATLGIHPTVAEEFVTLRK